MENYSQTTELTINRKKKIKLASKTFSDKDGEVNQQAYFEKQ